MGTANLGLFLPCLSGQAWEGLSYPQYLQGPGRGRKWRATHHTSKYSEFHHVFTLLNKIRSVLPP